VPGTKTNKQKENKMKIKQRKLHNGMKIAIAICRPGWKGKKIWKN
jgi:hypothetical protein